MRFQGEDEATPILHGYLTSPLPQEAVERIRIDFDATAEEQVRLVIHNTPAFYGKSAEEIRSALDQQAESSSTGGGTPEPDDFVLIGEDVTKTGIAWYVGDWVTQEEFAGDVLRQNGESVVWRIRSMIMAMPSLWTNYSIGNSSIQEDLASVLVDWPWNPNAEQPPYGADDFPYSADQSAEPEDSWRPPAYVIAEPGEWEEGPGNLMDVDPPQERVYRLRQNVAEQHGLRSEWAIGWKPQERLNAPPGSMCFAQSYM
ncbi:hypothetical protein ACHAQH_007750 [Verticillium albo-atrum]